ncbi:hypothetical protein T484DRAFT_1917241 [Baffinella frigidus]|nr:hypothetical protein T484DRAFT_1917241 [Cryptophyta sp. CCMP2293]
MAPVAACVSCVVWLVLSMWNHRPAATAMFNGILAGLAGITPASGFVITLSDFFFYYVGHTPAGILAGLAGITPASGFVSTQATIVIGLLCGLLAYYGSQISKKRFHIDDALDVSDYELHFHSSPWQIFIQTVGVGIVGCYSFAVTWTILSAMKTRTRPLAHDADAPEAGFAWARMGPLAHDEDAQEAGLDWARMGPLAHDEDAQEAGLDWVDHGTPLHPTPKDLGEVAYCRLNVLREIRTTHPEAISHINGIAIPSEDDYMK